MQIVNTLEKGQVILLGSRVITDFDTKEEKRDEQGNVLAKYQVVAISGEDTLIVHVKAPLKKVAPGTPVNFEKVDEFLYALEGDKGSSPTRLSLSAHAVKNGVAATS